MKKHPDVSSVIDKLRSIPGIDFGAPAEACDIDSLEDLYGTDLTAEIRALYEKCNGITSGNTDSFVKTTDQVIEESELHFKENTYWPIAKRFGLLPIIDLWDGNWWCVGQLEPMCGRIFYFSHDDSPHLVFRNLAEALDTWADMVDAPDYKARKKCESRNSYSEDRSRTEPEREDGLLMGQIANEFPGRTYPASFQREAIVHMGLQLMSIDDLALITRLLDTEYGTLAYQHLKNIGDTEAEKIADDWMTQKKKNL